MEIMTTKTCHEVQYKLWNACYNVNHDITLNGLSLKLILESSDILSATETLTSHAVSCKDYFFVSTGIPVHPWRL